jgi:HYR domain
MRRSTGFSAFLSLLRAGFAGAIVLATILSCSDSTSPTMGPDGVIRVKVNTVEIVIPDSVKQAQAAGVGATHMVPIGPSMTVLSSPVSSVATVAAPSCGSGGGFAGYTKSQVPFAPEAIPNIAPYPLNDDGFIPDKNVPLGFTFSFEGNTYDKVNVYMNGFLLFGPVPSVTAGYPGAQSIAATSNPTNILALAWTDWSPQLVPDGIRYETRGTAPNRRFILQFNNVPEYYSASKVGAIVPTAGRLMSQVVLSEGSNDITIYTNQMNVTKSNHFVTQGIENAAGTDATYDSVTNAVTGIRSARVHNFFNLQNDAVRFSLIQTKDEVAPTITAPDNITANNDPGLASAIVTIVPPATSDDCTPVTLSSVRSDGVTSLSAPYPVGVTTITWTAKDDAGNTSSATQTVTVLDKEAPVFGLAAGSLLEFNATSPSGAIVTFNTSVTDNVGVTSLSCEPASGSLFAVGRKEVTCTASDAAGNTSHDSFTVSVIGAHEQLFNLLQYVIGLNLPNGTAQPLINQLRVAYSQDAAVACTKMADFLGMVQKKSGNIPSDEKEIMVAEATRIMNAMGCASTIRASLSAKSFPQF